MKFPEVPSGDGLYGDMFKKKKNSDSEDSKLGI